MTNAEMCMFVSMSWRMSGLQYAYDLPLGHTLETTKSELAALSKEGVNHAVYQICSKLQHIHCNQCLCAAKH